MKTLFEVQTEVAKRHHYDSWIEMNKHNDAESIQSYNDIAAKEFAREALEEAKKFSDYGEEIDKIELK